MKQRKTRTKKEAEQEYLKKAEQSQQRIFKRYTAPKGAKGVPSKIKAIGRMT